MDVLGVRGRCVLGDACGPPDLTQLAHDVLPLAYAQIVDELRPAQLAELVGRQLLLLLRPLRRLKSNSPSGNLKSVTLPRPKAVAIPLEVSRACS